MWWCKRCHAARDAQQDSGKPRVARLRNGFVAVWLECGHTAAVSQDRVRR